MSKQEVKTGIHFSQVETGDLSQWPDYSISLPGVDLPGKLFLKDLLGLTGCEISINSMMPGESMPFYHRHHHNEEVYIFIKGQGQVQIDGKILDVKEGSIVRIGPEAERLWRNNSDEQLAYIVLQVKENSLGQYGVDDASVPEKAVSWG